MTLFVIVRANEFDAAKKMAARGVPFADEKTVWGDPGVATLGLVSDQHEDRVVTAFYDGGTSY
jgi:hypothetical protein